MQTEHLAGRLRGVRKRKRAHRGFACNLLAQKMRLVRTTRRRPRRT